MPPAIALRLDNRHYVYETRHDDEALIVALNIDDEPLRLAATGRARAVVAVARRRREVVDTSSSSHTAG